MCDSDNQYTLDNPDAWPDYHNAVAASAALRAYVEMDSPQIDDRWLDVNQDIMHLFHEATSILWAIPRSETDDYVHEIKGWTTVLWNIVKIYEDVNPPIREYGWTG